MLTHNNFMGSSLIECILVRTFSCMEVEWRKARERELATIDEIDEQ